MAYNKTPQTSTYQTKTIQLVNSLNSRTGNVNKDTDFLNCFFEIAQNKLTGEKTIQVVKRAGLSSYIASASSVRGIHYWEDQSKLFVASGTDVAIYNSDTGSLITTVTTFGTTTGEVGFTEFLYDDNTVKVVITDGTTLGTMDTANTWVASADADLPTPHLPQPLFLDGYLFIAKANSSDIYNSDLNDPLAYTPGDFISCEMFPDTVLAIAKLNNYILAFGSSSIEYFWDAGNDTGSPLQRNDTPIKLLGFLGGLAQLGNKIYFVGNTLTSTPEIYMLEDFKVKPISDESVRRYLESLSGSVVPYIGSIVSCQGHDFYILNVGTLTYVFDLLSEQWFRWAFRQQTTFPVLHATSVKTNSTYNTVVFINGQSALFKVSPTIYQDVGTSFTMRIVTDNQMFDTYNRKTMAKLVVKGDKPTSTTSLSISWSDNDYQTFTTPLSLNLFQELPSLYRLGSFRRRVFKIEYIDNFPLRLQDMDVDINIGQA
jgi:hypothetical protein